MTTREQTSTGQFQVDAKLTEYYRLANPVGSQTIAPLCDRQGVLHVFSCGSDGHLYDIVQDTASDTGWSALDMHFSGSGSVADVAAGIEPDGTTIVFVADTGANFYYARDRRWGSQWQFFNSGNTPLVRIKLGRDKSGAPLFTAQTQYSRADRLNFFDYTQPNALAPQVGNIYDVDGNVLTDVVNDYSIGLDRSSSAANGVSTFLVGNCRKTAQGQPPFVEAGKKVPWTDGADDFWAWNISGGFSRLALAPSPSDPNDSAVFVLKTSDAGLYYLAPVGPTLVPLSGGVKLTEIAANLDEQGRLGVIALGQDRRLYHVHQDPKSPTGWTDMVSLNDQITFLSHATVTDRDGHVVAFAVDTANNLYWIWQDPATQNWTFEQIETSKGPIEKFEAYSTQITVIDALGAASANTPVELWASGPTPASVNGSSVTLDSSSPVICRTNAAGRLSVVVPADGLHTAALTVRANFMDPDEAIVIEPNADIQLKMRSLTADDLLNPKNPDGDPITLLTGPYNTTGVAQAMANAINQTMAIAGAGDTPPGTSRRYVSPRTPTARVRAVAARDPAGAARIDLSNTPDAHWKIDFSSGLPVFTQLTRAEAVTLMAARRAALPRAADGFGFDVDWGDVWSSVTGVVAEIVDVVVTAVVDTVKNIVTEIQAQVRLLIDKIEYVFDATIDFFEQAFDMVAGFFQKIAVDLKKLFDWLGFVFDWDDIRRTADAIAHVFDVSLTFLSDAAAHVQAQVDGAIDALSTFVQTEMDGFINAFSASQSIREAMNPVLPPEPVYESRVSHNVLQQALMENLAGATSSGLAVRRAATLPPILQQLVDRLQKIDDDFRTGPGAQVFQEAVRYFEAIGNQPEHLLELSLQGLLKLVESMTLFAIQGAKTLFDLLFEALQAAIGLIRSLLAEQWSIPLVSDIYQLATGKSLTFAPVDLFALAVAIPSTAIYKVIKHAPPFPTDTALETFKAGFTAAWVEQRAWGGRTVAAAGSEPWLDVVRGTFDVAYSANFLIRMPVETFINTSLQPPPAFVSIVNLTQRFLGSFFSMPWVMKDPSSNPSRSETLENNLWYYQILAGPTRGAVVLIANVDPRVGNASLAAWGAIHLGAVIQLAVVEGQENASDPLKTAENILSCLAPQALKVILLFPAQSPVGAIGRLAFGVVTASSETAIAALHFVRWLTGGGRESVSMTAAAQPSPAFAAAAGTLY